MTKWFSTLGLFTFVLAAGSHAAEGQISVEGLVRLIESVDVPAGHEGRLEKVLVKEGALIRAGELLGQIDAAQAELTLKRTQFEQQLAEEKANSEVALNLARSTKDVAQAEFERARLARKSSPGSLSASEFDRLRLDAEKSGHELARVKEEKQFAVITSQTKAVEVELAKLALEQRRIASPLDGIIVQIFRHEGEWVHPGEKVLRVVRIDRLRVEAFVELNANLALLEQAAAELKVAYPEGPAQQFTGEIVFIHPEADPVNGQIRIWAEIENHERLLRPGQRGQLTIHPKRKGDNRQLPMAPSAEVK